MYTYIYICAYIHMYCNYSNALPDCLTVHGSSTRNWPAWSRSGAIRPLHRPFMLLLGMCTWIQICVYMSTCICMCISIYIYIYISHCARVCICSNMCLYIYVISNTIYANGRTANCLASLVGPYGQVSTLHSWVVREP